MPGLFYGLKGLTLPGSAPVHSTTALYQQTSQWLHRILQQPPPAPSVSSPPPAVSHAHMSHPPAKKPKLDNIQEKHVFFDVETHGLSKVCLAIQLSFLVTEIKRDANGQPSLQIVDHFDGCFPADYISPGASAIHGITLEKLQSMADQNQLHQWTEITPRLLQHFEQASAVVGHNVHFDIRSIRDTMAYHGLTAASQRFTELAQEKKNCTLQMARSWTKSEFFHAQQKSVPENHKLTTLYQSIFNDPIAMAHDAAADTLATAALFYFLKSELAGEFKDEIKDESIRAQSSPRRPRPPKLAEPEEIYNAATNSMSWLVVEHNHDRRHIIPKSLLRLFLQNGMEKFGQETLINTCLQHPRFAVHAPVSLTEAAKDRLEHHQTLHVPPKQVQEILYILLKHNRFNYFLGESSWNRVIGAPMRYLRGSEPETLKSIAAADSAQALSSIISMVFENIDKCLTGQHLNAENNVSFIDPRGPDVAREGMAAVKELQTSLEAIQSGFLTTLQDMALAGADLTSVRHEVRQMIRHLQDSFAFDMPQSRNQDVRIRQNQHLSQLYTQMQAAIEASTQTPQDREQFVEALHGFLNIDRDIMALAATDDATIYSQENPVYAARQLSKLILNHD